MKEFAYYYKPDNEIYIIQLNFHLAIGTDYLIGKSGEAFPLTRGPDFIKNVRKNKKENLWLGYL